MCEGPREADVRERNPEGLLRASSPKWPLSIPGGGGGEGGEGGLSEAGFVPKAHPKVTHITVLLIKYLRTKAEWA